MIPQKHLRHALHGALFHTATGLIERHWGSPRAAIELPADIRKDRRLGSRDRRVLREGLYAVARRAGWWEDRVGGDPVGLWRGALVELGVPVEDAFPEGPPPDSEALDLPQWLVDRSRDASSFLEGARTRPPLILRVNTQVTSRKTVLRKLHRMGVEAAPTERASQGIRVEGHPNLRELLGQVEVQDEGSQLLAELVQGGDGLIVDLCAGAGGKTLAIAARHAGRIVACDIRGGALEEARKRAKRAGFKLETVQLGKQQPPGDADTVLIDAPCSGTGTLGRDPLRRWWITPDTLEDMRTRQADLLRQGAGLVAPGGQLVYGTCSVLPEENEAQIEAFLAAHPDWRVQGEPLVLRPEVDGTDGYYGVVLVR